MKPTRVAHLTSVHPVFDVRIFQKECTSLVKAGYDVILVAPHDKDECVNGVTIRPVKAQPRNRLDRMIRTAYDVTRLALEDDCQIYHIHDPELLPWAQIFRIRGKYLIYDMHENLPKAILSKSYLPSVVRLPLSWLIRLLEMLLTRGLPVIFAENSYSRDYSWVQKQATVLNMPISEQLFSLHVPKKSVPTICYMGAVDPLRGSLVTIQALHLLKEAGCSVGWECIGAGSEVHIFDMKDHIDKYCLENVQLRGYMAHAEAVRIVASCHVGLALLAPIPNYVETYPTKIFEYMALGLPVVVSDFPMYRQIVEGAHCGFCVNPQDPKAIAAAVQWLVEHPYEAESMGRRGQEAVQNQYDWSVEEAKLLRFYEELRQ